jgi:anhydro-N-acetylmuramic acid kinase
VRTVLGMMSGTSADGVDATCVRVLGRAEAMKVEVLWHASREYPCQLRERLLAVMAPAATTTEELSRLHSDLGRFFGEFARTAIANHPADQQPEFIGLAGQTVCHLPAAQGSTVTFQLGEPAIVAAETDLPVVGDFRQSDVAVGGQGAPIVAWTDWVLLRDDEKSRAIQNIGGIGNVTWLPAGCGPDEVVAFDTGPGNMVIDGLMGVITDGKTSLDLDGRLAGKGQVLEDVLASWMQHPFFRRKPPKTTGRETFGRQFVEAQLPQLRQASTRTEDWIATATALTARSIADAYCAHLAGFSCNRSNDSHTAMNNAGDVEVVVCGGGARNRTLMKMLQEVCAPWVVLPITECGINEHLKESISISLLACACLDGVPSNLPKVTGAHRAVSLGRIARV